MTRILAVLKKSAAPAGRATMRKSSPTGVTLTKRSASRSSMRSSGPKAASSRPRPIKVGAMLDQELVDQPLAHERAVELVAGFDVQLVHAALGEQGPAGPRGRPCHSPPGANTISAPRAFQRRLAGRIGLRGDHEHQARRVEDARARAVIRAASRRSRAAAGAVVSTRRTSSRGLSSTTVPTPVSTADARLRQAWPSVRARPRR